MNDLLTATASWLEAFFSDWQVLIRVVAIIVALLVLRWALLLSVKRVVKRIVSGVKAKAGTTDTKALDASPMAKARVVQRARTMGSVLGNTITWGIYIVGTTMVLSELGVAVGALVAGAGILGAALGFGAQSLVRDLISGLFIVFEDQYGVGDAVDLGQATGVVESVGLRVTQVRDVAGTLWYVRNGEIVRVGNSSQGWSRVVIDIPLSYESNIEKAKKAVEEAALKLTTEPIFNKAVIGKPEVWGIEVLSGEQVVIRLVQQVRASKQDDVARELRLRVKQALDASKISLASGKQAIHVEVAGKPSK
jgi:small conductance mechanosensitive channel